MDQLHRERFGSLLHGRPMMSMLPPINKQGYLGDLKSKSKGELLDLIARQERILNNRNFVSNLPDKGEKIRTFLENLKDVFEHKFEIMEPSDKISEETNEKLTLNYSEDNVIPKTSNEEDFKIVEKNLSNLVIHEGPFYDVVKKAEDKNEKRKTSCFKVKRINNESKSTLMRNQNTEHNEIKSKCLKSKTLHKPNDDSLNAASYKQPAYGPAKILPISETREIILKRNEKCQELQMEKAAELLMQSINENKACDLFPHSDDAMDGDEIIDNRSVDGDEDEIIYEHDELNELD